MMSISAIRRKKNLNEKEKQLEVIAADIMTIKNKKSAVLKICDILVKDFEKLIKQK